MKKTTCRALRVILGDQLSHKISSLDGLEKDSDVVLMMEVHDEQGYVWHHKQKLIFVLSAMRHFAAELTEKSINVEYIKLDSKHSQSSFTDTLATVLERLSPEKIILTFPGEYRVLQMVQDWQSRFNIDVEIRDDTRFLCSTIEFNEWAQGKKQFRMEHFYRMMRAKTGLLMDNKGKPLGGDWNFDKSNRKTLAKNIKLPHARQFRPDAITQEVMSLVNERCADHFGEGEQFHWAVNRREALAALNEFIEHRLPHFGDYQDAMKNGEFTLFHSLLSPYLNVGLLHADECCEKAQAAYQQGHAPINSVEGFIRQILGWREYVRGIYWHEMPKYIEQNYFNARHKLPTFYWDGETNMQCLRHSIEQTRATAHSHHIQRLMVTGNFALLWGVLPSDICDWYLAVYLDAFDWVELPNTFGMVMFADGGMLASKPYIASGNYINKMSDFCQHCHYNVKKRVGDDACPFNALYWDFLDRHRDKLADNPRMKLPYMQLNKMSNEDLVAIQDRVNQLRDQME